MPSTFAVLVARAARAWVAAGLLTLVVACGDHTSTTQTPPPSPLSGMFLGADVSSLSRIEQAGGVFRDGGQAGDAIAILHAHGSNTFRLRLFVNPPDTDVVVNDLPYTVALAQRVKAAGARLLLDIQYSDTWADPGHQATPAAWASLGIDSLAARVQSYTDSVIRTLKQAGALPDIVQVGNEIDSGMLWPLGQLYVNGADTTLAWNQFTRLLKAGIAGVRAALGPGDSVRIMLHYGQGGDTGGTEWFFDHMNGYGVPYDVIGLSYYPWWHGTIGALEANLQATEQRYGKDLVVVETSYPWGGNGWQGIATNTAPMTWAVTPAGQAQYLTDLLAAVANVPGGHGAGVVWWYPEAIQVSGLYIWGGGSLSLFDATGNVLPAAGDFAAR